MEVFWSIVGSAFGGFLGVIAFFLVKWKIEINKSRPKQVGEYLCANELNQGQAIESEGELMHHHGRRISDIEELKLFEAINPIWEWTNQEVGKNKGFSIIFGPYTTDFDEPSMYSVTFVMRSIGLSAPKRKIDDEILLELDVNSSTPDYAMKPTGEFINFNYQDKISRGYVRISDLAKEGWINCVLKFYSNAKGIWEYRIMPYQGYENPYDRLKKLHPKVRIVFDKIIIKKIPKIQLPTV